MSYLQGMDVFMAMRGWIFWLQSHPLIILIKLPMAGAAAVSVSIFNLGPKKQNLCCAVFSHVRYINSRDLSFHRFYIVASL